MGKVYIVYSTYGDGEYDINKIFNNSVHAWMLKHDLEIREEGFIKIWRAAHPNQPYHGVNTKFGVDEYEVYE